MEMIFNSIMEYDICFDFVFSKLATNLFYQRLCVIYVDLKGYHFVNLDIIIPTPPHSKSRSHQ